MRKENENKISKNVIIFSKGNVNFKENFSYSKDKRKKIYTQQL